jgi:alcohol dehydrogenase
MGVILQAKNKPIRLIQAGKINTNFLCTHHAPLDDIVKGYDIFGGKKDNCLKWIVTSK